MSPKHIITITLLGVLFEGCTTYKNEYDNQSFFGLSTSSGYHNSVERDTASLSNTQNPMARPSYEEYRDSIEKNKFEPK